MARTVKRYLTSEGSDLPMLGVDNDSFGQRLWTELAKRNWSQTELAKRVWNEKREGTDGYSSWVGRDRISSYVRGKCEPSPAILKRIAEVLGTTPEELSPKATAKIVASEAPALQINMAPGHSDKCLLRINKLVSLQTALAVGKLIDEDENP